MFQFCFCSRGWLPCCGCPADEDLPAPAPAPAPVPLPAPVPAPVAVEPEPVPERPSYPERPPVSNFEFEIERIRTGYGGGCFWRWLGVWPVAVDQ